jgi:fucose 4-O-acetylase-like acetyltransferase
MIDPAPPPAQPSIARTQWIDNAKGQAIFLVVLAHVWRGLRDADMLAWGSTLKFLDYTVYSFHMPSFFILAGITAFISDNKRRSNFDNVVRLYAVYLFWSLIQTTLMFALSAFTTGKTPISDIILIPIKANAQFWFLLVLILFRLSALVVPKSALLPLGLLLFVAAATFEKSEYLPFQIMHFMLFFVLGYRSFDRINNMGSKTCLLILPAFVFLMIVGSFLFIGAGITYDSVYAIVLAVIGFVVLFLSSKAMAGSVFESMFNYLGSYSMPIYILHIMAASGIRIAAAKAGLAAYGLTIMAIGTAAGILVPILVYIVMKKMGLEGLFTMKWIKLSHLKNARPSSGL